MSISKEAQKVLEKRCSDQKELAIAAQKLFLTSDGALVLDKISDMCNENKPTYVDQNPNGTAYKEGQRSIILGIRSLLNKTFNIKEQEKAEL